MTIRPILLVCALALVPMVARAADPTVIEAARQEGSLAVADTAPGENFQKFMAAFKANTRSSTSQPAFIPHLQAVCSHASTPRSTPGASASMSCWPPTRRPGSR